MSIAFHASSRATAPSVNPANGSTITITLPTVSAGDIVVVGWYVNNGAGGSSTSSVTAPAGWTQIGTTATEHSTDYITVQHFWALQSVSSKAFTVNNNGGGPDIDWVCASFSGVDNTTPIDATGTNVTTANSPASFSSFACGTNVLPVFDICDFSGGTFTATNFTILPTATPGTIAGAMGYKNSTVSGTTGTVSVTDSAGSGALIAAAIYTLKPAAGASFVEDETGLTYSLQTIW